MNIMQKLSTALRGSVREAAEVVIDANSLRILGQEIHECEQDITSSKQRLALIIAEKIQVKRDLNHLLESSKKHEKTIIALLNEDNEAQAAQAAQLMAELEPRLEQKQQHLDKLKSHEQNLQDSLKKMMMGLEAFKNEYKMAKATANMQKAQSALSNSSGGSTSRFTSMQESLERIQEKQQESADKMEAMEQVNATLSTDPMAQSNEEKTSASDILQRIKAKQTATN